MSATYVRCSQCGEKVRARSPKGGDGSALRPYKHLIGGEVCRGTYDILDAADALDDDGSAR